MDCILSVIIPVYNNERTLPDIIETLRAQTLGFDKIEAVFCDDCSTDRSAELLKEYKRLYPDNVAVLSTPENTGFPGEPRNIAVAAARGRYLMFLDGDDTYDKDACRALVEAIEREDADIAGGYYRIIDLDDPKKCAEKGAAYLDMKPGLYDFSDGFNAWCPVGDSLWAKLYKKDIVVKNNIRFDTDYAGDDGQFLTEYLCCCKNGVYVDAPVYNYAVHQSSFSHTSSYRYLSTICKLYPRLEEITDKYKRSGYLPDYYSQFTPLSHFCDRMVTELGGGYANQRRGREGYAFGLGVLRRVLQAQQYRAV